MPKRDIAGAIRQANMEFNISMWSIGHQPLDHILCEGCSRRLPMTYGYRPDLVWDISTETKRRQRPVSARKVKHIRRRYMRIW